MGFEKVLHNERSIRWESVRVDDATLKLEKVAISQSERKVILTGLL